MTKYAIRIAFDDTPLSEAVDLDVLVVEHESARQRYALEQALIALGQGDTDKVKQWVNSMERTL